MPGLIIPQKGATGPSTSENYEYNVNDFLNHPNMKVEIGTSVFHDTGAHPVKPPEIIPLLPPSSHEKTAAPDPKDGIDILLDNMIHTTGLLKWRDNTPVRHMKCFSFLLQRFREVYLPNFCPGFDNTTSIYDPILTLPIMRTTNSQKDLSSCIYSLVSWVAKFILDQSNTKYDNVGGDESGLEDGSIMGNLKFMGYTQKQLIRDVLYSSRDTINFMHEVFRQAFLMNYKSRTQIETMKYAIAVYKKWVCDKSKPPFLLEPDESNDDRTIQRTSQRLRTDSYLGAMIKENQLIRAGLQNVLQVFFTHAANVFMVRTEHLDIKLASKTRDIWTTPLDEQIEICKRVLSIYRHMVINVKKDIKTWEQILLVLLQITSVILTNPSKSSNRSKNNLGNRLAQPIFQTLIVTWIRAHTNVNMNSNLWEKFVTVLSSMTDREELIIEWNKTMEILTRVLGKEVYNINLQDLPLDRLADPKNKRRRGIPSIKERSIQPSNEENIISVPLRSNIDDQLNDNSRGSSHGRSLPSTPALSRSYSEGSLAPHRKSRGRRRLKSTSIRVALPNNVEDSLNRLISTNSNVSVSNEALNSLNIIDIETLTTPSTTLRRVVSLDSIRPIKKSSDQDDQESYRGSRSPSPTASSGIEGGSIKDSPMQIDMMTGDSSSIDTQEDGSVDQNRSIIAGGKARGWQPDVASVMWKRMLGALGDVNQIQNPKLHAKVFKYLYDITVKLIKIKLNQGISCDNMITPPPASLIPPIGITTPWCYGALSLPNQFREGKLWSIQLLCTIARHGGIGTEQLPLFYNALHQSCDGEDRIMAYTALKYLGGSRFLSLMLPGHSLLLLDLVHASTMILTSSDISNQTPRSEVAGLLGSLLCFPKTSFPKPALKPSEKQIILTEYPDLQELILNAVLRCARREPTTKARCIAIAALGQWVLQVLTHPSNSTISNNFKQSIPQPAPTTPNKLISNPRLKEVIQVLLQALQFRHKIIARVASDALKLCSEQGKNLANIERLPNLIIKALCIALEIQNVPNPKDSDKTVITSLLLCLGEFCMSIPLHILTEIDTDGDNLISNVLHILHQISIGAQTEHTKRFIADEDFDMTFSFDDVKEDISNEVNYQTNETIQNYKSAIKLCAKTVIMHLVTNLGHFPMGIGASRLSSLVEEQDDLSFGTTVSQVNRENDLGSHVLNSPNLQMLLLSSGLIASFVELPSLKLPGGGITAGLVTAKRQVRVLLRDLSGKACWDASILYREPSGIKLFNDNSTSCKNDSSSNQQQYFADKFTYLSKSPYAPHRFNNQIDPMMSSVGMPTIPPRHTMRHRPPHQLPLAKDLAPDFDQLNDLLQYIEHSSPECLNSPNTPLNTAGPTPLSKAIETQMISIILNQRATEQDFVAGQNCHTADSGYTGNTSLDSTKSLSISSDGSESQQSKLNSLTSFKCGNESLPFQYCRLLFSQLGLAGWERRKRTHLLSRTDKLLRELRNLDTQRCRETHKMAVIYVAAGQEDKNSILRFVIYISRVNLYKLFINFCIYRNSCGSSTYEMFVSALGWEVELESHNGFLGGLPRVGCGSTAPYYATPFLEVIYHVATRMPTDSPEAILNKTRHLGNDEVHIVWSEHNRDYRRDILPTEFCDILIVVYPLKSGLFRVIVNKKMDVPWFGPLWDEAVVSGACLASLVRATAINASRAKRTALPFYQQLYVNIFF